LTINSGNILNLEKARAIVKKGAKHDNITELEEGWAVIYKAILQLRSRLEEGDVKLQVTAEEYSIVYNMCTRYAEEMYDRYKDSIKEYRFNGFTGIKGTD
jgi:hypothetical protein